MRIAVYGAGAVGGHIAARMAAARHDVSVIARGSNLEAVRKKGIVLKTLDRTISAKVFATDRSEECGRQDVVFVTLKANALGGIHDAIGGMVDARTLVVFAQNGLPWWYPLDLSKAKRPPPAVPLFTLADEFLRVIQPEQIVGAVVQTSNEVVEPGVIVNASPKNAIVLGHADDRKSPELDQLREALSASGLASPPVEEIRQTVWLKLLRNTSSSLIAAATLNSTGIVKKDPMLAEIFKRIVAETMEVASAYGYPLRDLTDPELMLEQTTDVVPSLLQDYRLGRPMEMNELIFTTLAFARAAPIDTPTIDAVAAVARRLAADKGLVEI